jgi:hypothetical protein
MLKFNHIFLSVNARIENKIDTLGPALGVVLCGMKAQTISFTVLEPAEFED